MHVHSYFSGACTTPFLSKFCRESYSDPVDVYELLRRRGMNLFTLTDHDSIEGSEKLRSLPNFFLSEELTCRMPSGTEIHVGVYDITERQHTATSERTPQRSLKVAPFMISFSERRLLFSINHVFSNLTGVGAKREDFAWFREYFPAIETRNSHMLERSNANAQTLARQWEKIAIGGSDAHALPSAGTAYTEVSAARSKEEFFAGLRNRARGKRCR